MQFRFIIAGILVCYCIVAPAQTFPRWGIRVGGNISNVRMQAKPEGTIQFQDGIQATSRGGYQIGIVYERQLPKHLRLQTDIFYTQKGSIEYYNGRTTMQTNIAFGSSSIHLPATFATVYHEKITTRRNYLEIPVNVAFPIPLFRNNIVFLPLVGLNFGIPVGGNGSYVNTSVTNATISSFLPEQVETKTAGAVAFAPKYVNLYSIGYNFGLGIEIVKKIKLSAVYTLDITQILTQQFYNNGVVTMKNFVVFDPSIFDNNYQRLQEEQPNILYKSYKGTNLAVSLTYYFTKL